MDTSLAAKQEHGCALDVDCTECKEYTCLLRIHLYGRPVSYRSGMLVDVIVEKWRSNMSDEDVTYGCGNCDHYYLNEADCGYCGWEDEPTDSTNPACPYFDPRDED